jgi:hypothetical protein
VTSIPHREKLRLFLDHLGRGGSWQYWWTSADRRSSWWRVGQPGALPSLGRDIYFGICPTHQEGTLTTRSTLETVAAVNTLWADFDAKDARFGGDLEAVRQVVAALPVQPSVIVASGGGLHCYWLLDEPVLLTDGNRAAMGRILRRWAEFVGADTNAADLPRVLRVPGTRNHKYVPARDVTWERWELERVYALADLTALLPPVEVVQPMPYVAPELTRADEHAKAQQALGLLSRYRADSRDDWLKIGMALKADLGESGFSLWDDWSRQSEKYNPKDQRTIWRSFKRSGVTIATLYAAAAEDAPAAWQDVVRSYNARLHQTAPQRASSAPRAPIEATPMESSDNAPQQPATKPRQGITLDRLQNTEMQSLTWVVEGILPEGATVLAAKPKARKSWLALNIALAVAQGGRALGDLEVERGRVLFLDLEGNQRRIKSRVAACIGMLDDRGNKVPWPKNFEVFTEWSQGETAIAELSAYHENHPDLRLVVIDLLAEIRPPLDPKQQAYDYDRQFLRKLNAWAEERHVAALVIHHVRKAKGDDIFDEISGTLGINGAVSAMLILARDTAEKNKVVMHRTGRDMVEDDPITLQWSDNETSGAGFGIDRAPGISSLSDTRQKIIGVMSHLPMTVKEIAQAAGLDANVVRQRLHRMLDQGQVVSPARGKYHLPVPTQSPSLSSTLSIPHNNRNNDNNRNNRNNRNKHTEEVAEFVTTGSVCYGFVTADVTGTQGITEPQTAVCYDCYDERENVTRIDDGWWDALDRGAGAIVTGVRPPDDVPLPDERLRPTQRQVRDHDDELEHVL